MSPGAFGYSKTTFSYASLPIPVSRLALLFKYFASLISDQEGSTYDLVPGSSVFVTADATQLWSPCGPRSTLYLDNDLYHVINGGVPETTKVR